ncbi:nitrous oxide reductase family maturation protein NosD [Lacihabitans sp. LS3-19]|uniref:nitrous oxide reductase family maturation protein NosD n=1 Tax=Lacihabitans sp. LS3-19 TaxID=2487335 RepID=UPI0020CCA195|nr:nitrous oxide reductase family maturation protein NosD [Lacihabitans sp. LS3-19]MCP9770651.1 nitrous oxide reductase family maturation protein NosD [Lacihabitans sp. LS3-19]
MHFQKTYHLYFKSVLLKVLLLICLVVSNIFAKKINVKNKSELLKAIQECSDGDIIMVSKGRYEINNLTINKSIQLLGIGLPIFDGKNKGEILAIKASNVIIKDLRFEHVGVTSSIDWAAIKVIEASNVQIIENQIFDSFFGIYLSASQNCLIKNNQIKGSPQNEQNTGNGFHAWKCDKIRVENNTVEGHRDGFYFEFVTNSEVTNNLSFHNIRYGLHFMFSHKNNYSYNTFDNNGAGVAVMYTKMVTMKHNVFKNNWGSSSYGILLKDITDSEMENNVFENNTMGILMEGCNRFVIKQNDFTKNGVAIRMQANCESNELTENNFKNNTFDMATNGTVVSNTLNNNYWDKYDGYDLNKDGIGDYAYRPISLFSTLIERMPQTMMLLRSFTATLLDKIEKVLPSFTPENLKDINPKMNPFLNFERA